MNIPHPKGRGFLARFASSNCTMPVPVPRTRQPTYRTQTPCWQRNRAAPLDL